MLVVLVVDDDPAVADSLVDLLQACGYGVMLPPKGFSVADIAAKAIACDVLLTDIMMPGVDGWAVIRAARTARPDLPILAMSGHDLSPYPALAGLVGARTGADVLLSKPLRAAQLVDEIERVVAARRPGHG